MLPGKTPLEAMEMLRAGAILVDVRERDEIAAAAYDVEALLILPLSEAQDRLDEIPRDRPIVWACRSGRRSRQIGEALWAQGFDNAVNLEGGIIEWARQGLPVVLHGERQPTGRGAAGGA
ncbi:rhodanese-like domain-containing protein [Meinhardsimonia xiamenensis]|jgi:rhodanese-related sulfurtransferase|nr:rhodanese-like domain-containing protein [Meinhardsimonia xiamenensis]